MGPRSIDRGLGPYEIIVTDNSPASMGPRSIDRGIRFRDGLFTFWCTASMGPRSIDRGIPGFMTLAGGSGFQLQWGRDQLIAELEYSGLKPQTQAASMGPRSIDRGIRPPAIVSPAFLTASMGPRSIDRGIEPLKRSRPRGRPLQWGRAQLRS